MIVLPLTVWAGVYLVTAFFTNAEPANAIVRGGIGGLGFGMVYYYLKQRE